MSKYPILKTLASLRLAVFILLAIAALTAWGTFVEAKYDAMAAQKIVYKSFWMYAVMGLLVVNLIAVMVDRWPWRARHFGFILAHIGIIILLIGSLVTHLFGIDGSMSVGIGESAKAVTVGETDFTVYASMDGTRYTKLFDREVDFFRDPPTPEDPLEVLTPTGTVRVTEYMPYAFRDARIVATQSNGGAAVRFQLQNENVNVTEWLLQAAPGREVEKDLGPARVVLASGPYLNSDGKNTLLLRPGANENELAYEIHTARTPDNVKTGMIRAGEFIETGWMGLVLRVLKYLPSAKEQIRFQRSETPTPLTTAAIKVEYGDKEQWLSVNSLLKLFSDQAVYVVAYANRRLPLDFSLKLKEFRIGRYPGTVRAASYASVVELPDGSETVISMNEPLKLNKFTFYQASFEEDEQGRPVASVLSVNNDPGRWLKYLGSVLLVLGTIYLFYFKRWAAKAAKRSVS